MLGGWAGFVVKFRTSRASAVVEKGFVERLVALV